MVFDGAGESGTNSKSNLGAFESKKPPEGGPVSGGYTPVPPVERHANYTWNPVVLPEETPIWVLDLGFTALIGVLGGAITIGLVAGIAKKKRRPTLRSRRKLRKASPQDYQKRRKTRRR